MVCLVMLVLAFICFFVQGILLHGLPAVVISSISVAFTFLSFPSEISGDVIVLAFFRFFFPSISFHGLPGIVTSLVSLRSAW